MQVVTARNKVEENGLVFELTLKLAQGNLPPQLFRVREYTAHLSPTMALRKGLPQTDSTGHGALHAAHASCTCGGSACMNRPAKVNPVSDKWPVALCADTARQRRWRWRAT